MIAENVTFLVDLSVEAVEEGIVFSVLYNFKIKLIVSLSLNRSEDRFDIICKAFP